jgi:hypothetical protein
MAQDTLTRIKERFKDATEFMRDQHARMREDAKFSNPADYQQWDEAAIAARKGRPMLTFDKTNQFVMQVVNDLRMNKPSIQVLPADSRADVAVAQKLNGVIRHIEYVSRADIAYDTAGEHAVRLGLGWIRVIPQVMRPETNEQEIRIMRVHDPLSCMLDPNSTMPDGSDAMWGFVGCRYTKKAFQREWPKAKADSFDDENGGLWFDEETVTVAEYFEVVEEVQNRIVAEDGQSYSEDDYWAQGGAMPAVKNYQATQRRVKWFKVTGCEILEETDFPSQYIPLIPVMGHEMWVEGKRYLCGLVRRMRDPQRFHNYIISAAAEAVALQPKAPFVGPREAIEGYEDQWDAANTSAQSVLPYNAFTEDGTPIPQPQRSQPPTMGSGWGELAQYSLASMEASVGMFAANLGKKGNATSGKQELAQQREGDVANFHFADNQSRTIEQLGRVIVDMIPRLIDTKRQARIVGEDGSQDFVEVDPALPVPATKRGRKVVAINPSVGAYDVRVKSGPSYTSQRQEQADQMGQLIQAKPELMQIIGDEWIKSMDWPGAEKIAQRLKAMLPPQLQALEDEQEELPPEAIKQIQGLQQQIQELSQALENAAAEADDKRIEKEKAEADMLIRGYDAVTNRMKVVPPMTPEQVQAIAMQTVQQALSVPPVDQQDAQPPMPEMPPPEMAPQDQPPQGGFFTPDEGMQ